jgi:hypothetical protein
MVKRRGAIYQAAKVASLQRITEFFLFCRKGPNMEACEQNVRIKISIISIVAYKAVAKR